MAFKEIFAVEIIDGEYYIYNFLAEESYRPVTPSDSTYYAEFDSLAEAKADMEKVLTEASYQLLGAIPNLDQIVLEDLDENNRCATYKIK